MYTCKSCGSGLRFDIELQKLKCDACSGTFEPTEIVKDSDGSDSPMNVNVFECPQCGGLLYSDDIAIADFCSFCGGHTVFSSRIRKESKPKKIIPFQITKDKVKKSYEDYLKKAIYAPSAYKKIGDKQDFRAIYMPYWNYEVDIHEDIYMAINDRNYTGKTGPCYYLSEATGKYEDRIHDASVSFADDTSMRIAPYSAKDIKEFTPSYLCGFYADTTDVDSVVYRDMATDKDAASFYESVRSELWKPDEESNLKGNIKPSTTTITRKEAEIALLPVWFFSYKSGKRVAYATVNGQTGVVDGDLPISGWKFAIGTVLIMAVLFGIFTALFTIKPAYLLVLTSFVLSIITIIYSKEIKILFRKENMLDDKGYVYRHKENVLNLSEIEYRNKLKEEKITDELKMFTWIFEDAIENIQIGTDTFFTVASIVMSLVVLLAVGGALYLFTKTMPIFGWIVPAALTFLYLYISMGYIKYISSVKGVGLFSSAIATVLAGIILIINPVFDLYYYIGGAVVLLAALISAIDLICGYNILATRPIPEFSRKRGGKNA